MITKFKIFENLEEIKYKEGDYVFLNLEELQEDCQLGFLDSDDWFMPEDPMFKITRVWKNNTDYPYDGIFYDGRFMAIGAKFILRKLTPKEIDEFELKLSVNQFNV